MIPTAVADWLTTVSLAFYISFIVAAFTFDWKKCLARRNTIKCIKSLSCIFQNRVHIAHNGNNNNDDGSGNNNDNASENLSTESYFSNYFRGNFQNDLLLLDNDAVVVSR